MGCVVIAMPRHDDATHIAELLKNGGIYDDVHICTTGSDILRKAEDLEVHAVICTRHFSDMGYEELASYLPGNVNILLLTKDATLVPFSSNVMRLLMPFKAQDLVSTVRLLLPYQPFLGARKKKKERTESEQKTIDEAKHILMERNEMTEPEAFRYLQKTSMDTGRTLAESAKMVLLLNSE